LKVAIYTAIYGGKDVLKDPINYHKSHDVDFFCFTDDKLLKSNVYKVIVHNPPGEEEVKKSKYIKILGCDQINKFDISIWHDGNIQIHCDQIKELIAYLGEADFATFKHPKRDNVFDEIIACIRFNKANQMILSKQFLAYYFLNASKKSILYEAGIFIKKNGKNKIFLDLWWMHVYKYSIRDQIPLGFLAQKQNPKIHILPGNGRNNIFSTYHPHHGQLYPVKTPIEIVIKFILIYLLTFLKIIKPSLKSIFI
jgi:hypothetical protein